MLPDQSPSRPAVKPRPRGKTQPAQDPPGRRGTRAAAARSRGMSMARSRGAGGRPAVRLGHRAGPEGPGADPEHQGAGGAGGQRLAADTAPIQHSTRGHRSSSGRTGQPGASVGVKQEALGLTSTVDVVHGGRAERALPGRQAAQLELQPGPREETQQALGARPCPGARPKAGVRCWGWRAPCCFARWILPAALLGTGAGRKH